MYLGWVCDDACTSHEDALPVNDRLALEQLDPWRQVDLRGSCLRELYGRFCDVLCFWPLFLQGRFMFLFML